MEFVWVKTFHIVAMVAWFAGLFYLPRLFVYHAEARDAISLNRFKIMERRLYYGITWPAALLTTFLGLWLLVLQPSYLKMAWMHVKLTAVAGLWIYHLGCGRFLRKFSENTNQRSSRFYRFYNEIPTVLLILILVMVVVQPF